jgi:hypothetical protein
MSHIMMWSSDEQTQIVILKVTNDWYFSARQPVSVFFSIYGNWSLFRNVATLAGFYCHAA